MLIVNGINLHDRHERRKKTVRVMNSTALERLGASSSALDDWWHSHISCHFNCKTDEINIVFYLILLRTRVLYFFHSVPKLMGAAQFVTLCFRFFNKSFRCVTLNQVKHSRPVDASRLFPVFQSLFFCNIFFLYFLYTTTNSTLLKSGCLNTLIRAPAISYFAT